MFECEVAIFLPLRVVGHPGQFSYRIASYEYDPGLQVGDEVQFVDAPLTRTRTDGQLVKGTGPRFTFSGQVRRRRKIVKPGVPKDSFKLLIEVEIADKEQFPEMVKYLREKFPGKYEDYQPSQDTESSSTD